MGINGGQLAARPWATNVVFWGFPIILALFWLAKFREKGHFHIGENPPIHETGFLFVEEFAK